MLECEMDFILRSLYIVFCVEHVPPPSCYFMSALLLSVSSELCHKGLR